MVTIREATQKDREALCQIQVSAIRELGKSHYSEADLEAWTSGLSPERHGKHMAERFVIVAEAESEILGFGALDPDTGKVCAVYVRPAHAGKGIGSTILASLISEAKRLGLQQLHCQASLNAREFYERRGFEPGKLCKHRFRDGREVDCILMTMTLNKEGAEPTDASDRGKAPGIS